MYNLLKIFKFQPFNCCASELLTLQVCPLKPKHFISRQTKLTWSLEKEKNIFHLFFSSINFCRIEYLKQNKKHSLCKHLVTNVK